MTADDLPPETTTVLEMGGMVLRPGDRIGPYIYEKLVATGGMAHVVLARDPSNSPIALKVLKASRMGTGLGRFRREFRALARLNHPNVIRVDAYGDIYGHPYIAMEYVEGKDLHQSIRAFRNLPSIERWRRCEEILVDLAEALAHVHKRGLVHRDLKPSNILIDRRGRCKLTDFGIVKDLDPANDPFVSTTLVGTWAYASPEQISGRKIDHRSDLYSLGVILYAMLTGRRPFVAKDMAGYLEAHRDQNPMPPSAVDPEVPPQLETICMKLLQKAPRDRYQSAQEILFQLERIDPAEQDGAATDEVIWEPPLVGRELELDRVRDAVSGLTRGDGGMLLIEGAEGTGRSRLLKAALDFSRLIGIPVHTARLATGEGAFDTLLRMAEDVGRELGPRTPKALGQALEAFVRGQGMAAGDVRYQLYDGVRESLDRLLKDGPQILAIDDMHHAPAPLADLVLYLLRSLVVRDQGALLVIITARTDVPAPQMTAFRDRDLLGEHLTRIELAPLSAAEVLEMVVSLVGEGERARALAERLHRESDGNPFFVTEFLRSMLQRGTLRGERAPGAEDDATEVLDGELDVPPGVRQMVQERVARHSPEEREVIELVATAGRELDLDVLLDALDVDEEVALDRIDATVDAGLMVERRVGLQSTIDFAQRKVGEVVYWSLSKQSQAALHRRLALVFEERHADNPLAAEAIGEHYRRAGDAGKAWRYLALAAANLRDRALLGEAWSVAERAGPLEPLARAALPTAEFSRYRLDLLGVRASALFNRGSWPEAADVLQALHSAALALSQDCAADLAALNRGTCMLRLGREDEGHALVDQVLASARSRHDRSTTIAALRRLATFAWERGDLDACERLASQGLVSATGPEMAASRAEILLTLSAVQASRGELSASTTGLAEAETILRELKNKRTHAVVLCNLAELYDWQGQMGQALHYSTEALGLARDVVYREGEAFAHQVRALTYLEVGDLMAATEEVQKGLAICEQTGIAGDMVATLYLYGRVALGLGEVEKAVSLLKAGIGAARKQDPELYRPALVASLARGLAQIDEREESVKLLDGLLAELEQLPLPRRTQVQILVAAGWLALGETDEALPLLREAARVALRRNLRNWALRSRIMLSQITRGEESQRAWAEARDLAKEILAGLPEDLAQSFRGQASLRRLLAS